MKKLLVIAVILFFPMIVLSQQPKKVAVWETKCSDNSITPFQSIMVRGGMETAVANAPGYTGYDRAAFDASTWSGPQNWYVHFTPKASGANVAVRYLFSDGTVQKQLIVHFVYEGSGIEDVEADSKAPQGVYTLFGQQLRTDNSTEGLPAGMYIVGGKKMIVK